MRPLWQSFVQFFTSLKLTVTLLALSIVLIFFATLDQQNLGIWGIQQKWFQAFIVLHDVKGFPVPIFPGGYFIGGLLIINLLFTYGYRFKFTVKKTGIILTHAGLLLLLLGELMTGLWQEEFQMRLDQGETKNYSESYRLNELVIIDKTDANFDDVVAIPEKLLARGSPLQHPKLPFRVVPKIYYPNSTLIRRSEGPNMPPSPGTVGIGTQATALPQALTYKQDERNLPSAFIELVGPEGSLGTWLVSPWLIDQQSFDYAGRTWSISLRFARDYKPFSLTLKKFSHDRYAGTEIPKNFSSLLHLKTADGSDDRDVLIYMNNPLRYAGLTFYQQGFDNNDTTTVLQVVRNPSWLIPYISCALLTLGLLVQFTIHLVGFANKRRAQHA